MKSLMLIPFLFISNHSFAAGIKSGEYNPETKAIELVVTYGGGCGRHDFALEVQLCRETFPVSCDVRLVEDTDDLCEAVITTKIAISLQSAGLDDSYYSGAKLVIKGDHNSSATVKLPEIPQPVELPIVDVKVEKARYLPLRKALEITVSHGGGCGVHEYALEVGACLETFPVQCPVAMVHRSDDECEAYLTEVVVISLKDAKVNNSYFSRASLTIHGTDGSSAEVRLPVID